VACVVDDDNFARQDREDRNLERTALDFAQAICLSSIAEDKTATALIESIVRDRDRSSVG